MTGGTGELDPAGVLDPDATAYVAAVREALADLDPDERIDILDDLVSHLHGVRADDDRPVHEVLGRPAVYAAELRAAAGLSPAGSPRPRQPPRPPDSPRPPGRGRGLLSHGVTDTVVWREVRAYLAELRPAWWLVRAWLGVSALAVLTGGERFPLSGPVIIPRVLDSTAAGALVLVAASVWSVRRGRAWAAIVASRPAPSGLARPAPPGPARLAPPAPVGAGGLPGTRRRGGLALALGGATVLGLVVVLGLIGRQVLRPAVVQVGAMPSPPASVMAWPLNIHAYRPDGTPVGPVLLYDEAGQPLVLGGESGVTSDEAMPRSLDAYSDPLQRQVEVVPPTGADGIPVANQYPRQLYSIDTGADGNQIRHPVPAPVVTVPARTPTTG